MSSRMVAELSYPPSPSIKSEHHLERLFTAHSGDYGFSSPQPHSPWSTVGRFDQEEFNKLWSSHLHHYRAEPALAHSQSAPVSSSLSLGEVGSCYASDFLGKPYLPSYQDAINSHPTMTTTTITSPQLKCEPVIHYNYGNLTHSRPAEACLPRITTTLHNCRFSHDATKVQCIEPRQSIAVNIHAPTPATDETQSEHVAMQEKANSSSPTSAKPRMQDRSILARKALHLPGTPQPRGRGYRGPRRSCTGSELDRILPCEGCEARFARKHDLDRHRRIHTLEAPYVCKGCGRGYRRSDARKRHWDHEDTCREVHAQMVLAEAEEMLLCE